MIGLLLNLVILALILGVAWWVVSLLPLPPPIPMIIQVILVLIFVIALIDALTGLTGVGWRGPLLR